MKKTALILAVFLAIFQSFSFAQDQGDKTPAELARHYMMAGDFNNAILVLNRAIQNAPADIQLKKDLAFIYIQQKNYSKAFETIKRVTDTPGADEQSYQILGMIYKALEDYKEADKMYKTALKQFPESGVLHADYGEMQWTRRNFRDAIALWEKGIQADPNYSGNYYHAAKYYYFTDDKIWSLIYGETFINLESYTQRTPEIQNLLLDGYKKLFADANIFKGQNIKNPFIDAYLKLMEKHSGVVASGININSLIALRTRFITEWPQLNSEKFPLRLFDYHQQLLKEGMFEAYNQWIFGSVIDLTAFQNWTTANAEAYNKFIRFQRGRIYKIPSGQFYTISN